MEGDVSGSSPGASDVNRADTSADNDIPEILRNFLVENAYCAAVADCEVCQLLKRNLLTLLIGVCLRLVFVHCATNTPFPYCVT